MNYYFLCMAVFIVASMVSADEIRMCWKCGQTDEDDGCTNPHITRCENPEFGCENVTTNGKITILVRFLRCKS
jgi:hypothetical protein